MRGNPSVGTFPAWLEKAVFVVVNHMAIRITYVAWKDILSHQHLLRHVSSQESEYYSSW